MRIASQIDGSHFSSMLSEFVQKISETNSIMRIIEKLSEFENKDISINIILNPRPIFNAEACSAGSSSTIFIYKGLYFWLIDLFSTIYIKNNPSMAGSGPENIESDIDFISNLANTLNMSRMLDMSDNQESLIAALNKDIYLICFLENVILHEMSHIIMGHCELLNNMESQESIKLQEVPTDSDGDRFISPETRIYFELEADRMSGTLIGIKVLGETKDANQIVDQISAHIACFMIFYLSVFKSIPEEHYEKTYPSPMCRYIAFFDGLKRGAIRQKDGDFAIISEEQVQASLMGAIEYIASIMNIFPSLSSITLFTETAHQDQVIDEYVKITKEYKPKNISSFRILNIDENLA